MSHECGGGKEAKGRGHSRRIVKMSEHFWFDGKKAKLEGSLDVKGLASDYCVAQAAQHSPPPHTLQ